MTSERSTRLYSWHHSIVKDQCILFDRIFFPFFSAIGYLELVFKNPPSVLIASSFVQSIIDWLVVDYSPGRFLFLCAFPH